MPKKACCCDPKGRHVAVACRYYGGHAVRYVRDSIPASAGISGFTGDIRFIGPDGFKTGTTGFQRVFGYTTGAPETGNPTGVQVRGPYKWEVNIERFDSTRDVIFLTRSGGGSSQYEWNGEQDAPRGGHSSLLQTRIKASLATEAFVGAGGTLFGGGQGSAIGACLAGTYNPNTVAGAGAGGGVLGRGGHGGLTNGIAGLASGGGKPGTQTAGGCAGGASAYDGTEFIGGTGGPQSGWGGGGRYAGGGGDNKAGGGGGASKWPTSMSGYNDISFSQDGSDRGPGNLCDPFINYYTVVGNNTAFAHAGIAGGANLVPDSDPNFPQPQTTVLGFGSDFNPLKEGVPGIIKVLWIDKYCPCDETKTELPDKMYICLTDIQYRAIQEYLDENPNVEGVKFDIDGETYIYFGICVNAYCDNIRLIDDEITNIRSSVNVLTGQAGGGQFMNDCCNAIIAWPICKIEYPDCFTCSNLCLSCYPSPKMKYCCENIDEKPDLYWSNYQGWVWQCVKTKFWFPFGKKPEDSPLILSNDILDQFGDLRLILQIYAANGFEKICLPVFGEGNPPSYLCSPSEDEGCEDLSCTVETGTLWDFPHPIYLPKSITVKGTLCGKRQRTSIFSSFDGCDCLESAVQCLNETPCLEPNEVSIRYNSFCSSSPTIVNGNLGDCTISGPWGGFNSSLSATYLISDITSEYPLLVKKVLGMTITIPKCPGTSVLPSFATLQGTCGRGIQVLDGFGLDLGTIASVLNQNPFGIIYEANQPEIYITPRYGARVCSDYSGPESDPAAAPDLYYPMETEVIDTPTSQIIKHYFRPRIYLYSIQLQGNGPGFSNTQHCNGAPCECTAPYYASQAAGDISRNCIWGYYNLVTMNEPIFADGIVNPDDGTCSIAPSILSRLQSDMISLPYEGWPGVGQYSVEIANCSEWTNFCADNFVGTRVSCTGKITGNVG